MSQPSPEPSGPPPQHPHPGTPGAEPRPGPWGGAASAPSTPGAPRPVAGTPLSRGDEDRWALLTHLSVPVTGFVGPLVALLVLGDRSPWLRANALEALNFSLLYTLVVAVSGVLTVLLVGFAVLPVAFVAAVVPAVLAALAVRRHELYRYPVSCGLVR